MGSRIKRAREAKDMKQREVALAVGSNLRNYAAYEAGDKSPSREKLFRLAEILEVPLDWLATGTDGHEQPAEGQLDRIERLLKQLIGMIETRPQRAGRGRVLIKRGGAVSNPAGSKRSREVSKEAIAE